MLRLEEISSLWWSQIFLELLACTHVSLETLRYIHRRVCLDVHVEATSECRASRRALQMQQQGCVPQDAERTMFQRRDTRLDSYVSRR
jgi:hypothetical protein